MKHFFPLILIFLITMSLFFHQTHAHHAETSATRCPNQWKRVEDAKKELAEARQNLQTVVEKIEAKVPAKWSLKGVKRMIKKKTDWREVLVQIPQLKHELDNARERVRIWNDELLEAEFYLKRCEARYHRCRGCRLLLNEANAPGHKLVTCSEDSTHQYYECVPDYHTETDYCRECNKQYVKCQWEKHVQKQCPTCRASYYLCSWGTCYVTRYNGQLTCRMIPCRGGIHHHGREARP